MESSLTTSTHSMNPHEKSGRDEAVSIPIFPLKAVLFPGAPMPLRIFEERYLRMLAERTTVDPVFGISLIVSGAETDAEPSFHRVGTTARLVSLNAQGSRLVDVVVVGHRRIRAVEEHWSRGYAIAEFEDFPDVDSDPVLGGNLAAAAQTAYRTYLEGVATTIGMDFEAPGLGVDPEAASFNIASRLPLDTWEQQELLENTDPISRLRRVVALLGREIALLHGGMVGAPLRTAGDRFTLN